MDFPNPLSWGRGLAAKIAVSTIIPDAGAIVTGADGSIRIGDGVTQLQNLPVGGAAVAGAYVAKTGISLSTDVYGNVSLVIA